MVSEDQTEPTPESPSGSSNPGFVCPFCIKPLEPSASRLPVVRCPSCGSFVIPRLIAPGEKLEPRKQLSRGELAAIGTLLALLFFVTGMCFVGAVLYLVRPDLFGLVLLFTAIMIGSFGSHLLEDVLGGEGDQIRKLASGIASFCTTCFGCLFLFFGVLSIYSGSVVKNPEVVLYLFLLGGMPVLMGRLFFNTAHFLVCKHPFLELGAWLLVIFALLSFLSGVLLLRVDIFRGVVPFLGGSLALLVAWLMNRVVLKAEWEKEQGGEGG